MRAMLAHLRIARPVPDLDRSADLYTRGLGLQVLGRFENHGGFDGVMLGQPGGAWHFEFTHSRAHAITPTPTPEDLAVLYLPDPPEWHATCQRMLTAGFRAVASFNPYWDQHGRSFEDPDGYRVVLQNADWHNAAETP